VAIDFVVVADQVVEDLPRGRAYLADQLQRAATSIALNIAEGAGERSTADKARIYRFACRSATECAAILDVCRRLGLAEESRLSEGRDLLVRVVQMLVRLTQSLE
jgi:four helix bundle protein